MHTHTNTHTHTHTHTQTNTHTTQTSQTNSILRNLVHNSIQPKHTWFKSDHLLTNFSMQDQFSKAVQEDWKSKITTKFGASILYTTKALKSPTTGLTCRNERFIPRNW